MAPPRAPTPPPDEDRSAGTAARRLGGGAAAARGAPAAERDALRPAAAAPPAPVPRPAWRRRLDGVLMVRDPMRVAIIASLLLHAFVMFMKFSMPAPIRVNPNDARLEVVLLNAQTRARPVTPEVLAQVNQEGGGEHERGRAKSPLAAETVARDGTVLQEQRRRVDELERQQRELMTIARGPQAYVMPEKMAEAPRPDAADRDDLNAVLARMQAEIARNVEDYNKRPKRLTFGVNAVGVNYARYVADWATKIERIGTERFPPEARGRQYDSLIITVEIDKHGNVVDVVVNKKSKYEALNRAVKQIVYAGQPYERFPPEMAREGDILQIVRTWTFTNDALETSSLRGDR
ncbi:MAG: TonB C-terminal domain-containing protein [Burkholderiales bacterium]